MATYEMVDSVVDKMISRIQENITSLGGSSSTPVIEGDEYPERVTVFPSIYIIPLIEGGDHLKTHMGGITNRFHEFTVTIIGLYKASSVTEALRTTRQYAYTCADLFSDKNQKVIGTKGGAIFIDPVVNVGYHRPGDKVIHTWSVKLTARSVTI